MKKSLDTSSLEDAKKALVDFDNAFFARHDFNFELLDKLVIEERLREKNRIAGIRHIIQSLILSADFKLNESYFFEGDSTEKPYSKEEIKSMLNTGSIRLSSKIKFGPNTKEFQSLHSFEEFNQDYRTFL